MGLRAIMEIRAIWRNPSFLGNLNTQNLLHPWYPGNAGFPIYSGNPWFLGNESRNSGQINDFWYISTRKPCCKEKLFADKIFIHFSPSPPQTVSGKSFSGEKSLGEDVSRGKVSVINPTTNPEFPDFHEIVEIQDFPEDTEIVDLLDILEFPDSHDIMDLLAIMGIREIRPNP